MQTNKNLSSITIGVNLMDEASQAKEVYLVGCHQNLGAWDPSKAIKLKKRGNYFHTQVELGQEIVEFKLLSKRDWSGVEKGINGEEICNHQIMPTDTSCTVDVKKWNC